jgi:hypothetical protein
MADTTTKILEVVVDNNRAVTAIAEYNRLIDEQKQLQKELAQQAKDKLISEADYYKAVAKSKEEVKAYSRSVQELSKEVQNNIKDAQEQEGSLRGLRAQLSNLTKEFDALSRAERNGEAGRLKMEEINRITTELKEAEAETQRFYRNVGNYPDFQPLETQLGELKKQLQQMKFEGKENTEEFAAMAKQASAMKDAIADVEQQINAGASDTAQLDSLIQGTSTLLALYAQYSTISSALGVENEELDKTFKILATTLGVLTAAQTVQNALQSQSAVMRGLEAAKTWLQVAAEKAQAAALTKTGLAQKAATAAQWAFNKAAAASPLGLLVTALIAATAAVYGLVKAFVAFTRPSKTAMEAFKKTGEELNKLDEKYAEHIDHIKAAGASEREVALQTIALNKDMARRRAAHFKEAKKLYKEDEEAYKEALEAKKAADEAYQKSLTDARRSFAIEVAKFNTEQSTAGMSDEQKQIRAVNKAYEEHLALIKKLKEEGEIGTLGAQAMEEDAVRMRDAELAKIRKEAAEKRAKDELSLLRELADARLDLIKDENQQARAQEEERYSRAIADLKKRLETEKHLSAKERKAINDLIEVEHKKHQQVMADLDYEALQERLKNDADLIRTKLEAVRKGGEEEFKLKLQQLEAERDLELSNLELTEDMKAAIRAKYDAQEAELRKERNNKILEESQELVELEWANRINEAAVKGQNTLELEMEAAKARLDSLHQLEGESDAEFRARQLEAQREYVEAGKKLTEYEVQIQQDKFDAIEGLTKGLTGIIEAFGEDNEKAAKASKILALAEIAINTGKAIAVGVAQAAAAGPFPMNIAAIGTTIATVLANIASAISTVKSAKFALGGYVSGPGTATSDSIPARLSNGESVMNAKTTSMFGPLLSSLNQAGGGVAFNPATGGQREGYEFLAAAVAAGMKGVKLHVAVDEVSRVQDRVEHIKDISTIK